MRLKFVLQTSMDFSLSWQEFVIAQNHHTIWQAHRCLKLTVPQTPHAAVLELMTCRFVVNALIHCATRLGNNLGKKKITDFIVSFDR